MNPAVILGQVVVLFIIMLVGIIARKAKLLADAGLSAMSTLALYVALPCTILVSFQSPLTDGLLWDMGQAFLWSLGLHCVMWLLGRKIFNRFPKGQHNSLRFAAIFSNAAFMGYPVLQAVFGYKGLLIGAMYVSVFNIFLWTVGTSIFYKQNDRHKTLRLVLLNPGIVATALGIVTFVLSIKIPEIPLKAVTMLGNMTTPLSMLIVGARLADVRLHEAFTGSSVYLSCALRLLIIPLALLALMRLCHVSSLVLGVVVLQAAMPVAANTTLFAEMYSGDSKFASRLVFISTLFSIITIPLAMLLVI